MRLKIADDQRRLRFLAFPKCKVNAATDPEKPIAKPSFRDWKNKECERKLDGKIKKKVFSTELIIFIRSFPNFLPLIECLKELKKELEVFKKEQFVSDILLPEFLVMKRGCTWKKCC